MRSLSRAPRQQHYHCSLRVRLAALATPRVQQLYVACSRELKRLDSLAFSPIFQVCKGHSTSVEGEGKRVGRQLAGVLGRGSAALVKRRLS